MTRWGAMRRMGCTTSSFMPPRLTFGGLICSTKNNLTSQEMPLQTQATWRWTRCTSSCLQQTSTRRRPVAPSQGTTSTQTSGETTNPSSKQTSPRRSSSTTETLSVACASMAQTKNSTSQSPLSKQYSSTGTMTTQSETTTPTVGIKTNGTPKEKKPPGFQAQVVTDTQANCIGSMLKTLTQWTLLGFTEDKGMEEEIQLYYMMDLNLQQTYTMTMKMKKCTFYLATQIFINFQTSHRELEELINQQLILYSLETSSSLLTQWMEFTC